nr:DUF2975 domain-containing protein [Thalassobacillus sp. CUG 92003]
MAVLALCIGFIPWMINQEGISPEYAYIIYSILIAMYVAAIPFFMALYQALRLLHYIDKDTAFSDSSVKALRLIKLCAGTISVVYVGAMPFFYLLAEKDDAPGVILIGLVFIFASIVIGVFAAILQKLLKNAIDIKSENDLTV